MADESELEGRVGIVVGSSSGIGEQAARRMSALGARRGQLVVLGRGR